MEALILAASSAATGAGISAAAGSTIGPVTASALAGTAGGQFGSLLAGAAPFAGTALSGFGALTSIAGGSQESAYYKAQAQQSELSARAEELKGREQADKIRRSLQATLASQNAAFAARGISTSGGTPVRIGNVSRSEAARDIENAQFNAGMSAAAERGTAASLRTSGRVARYKGYTDAFGMLARSSLV